MKFNVSPLTRKRWLQFRRNRRAWGSLYLLAGLYILSLGAELLCNDQPLLIRVNGRTYLPFLRYVSQDELFGNGVAARPDYDRLARDPAFLATPGNRMLRAPVPHGRTSGGSATLELPPRHADDHAGCRHRAPQPDSGRHHRPLRRLRALLPAPRA